MEQGEYKVGLDTLFKILQVFDLKMGEFFGETDSPAEKEARDLAAEIRGSLRRGAPGSARLRAIQEAARGSARTPSSDDVPADTKKKSLEMPGRVA